MLQKATRLLARRLNTRLQHSLFDRAGVSAATRRRCMLIGRFDAREVRHMVSYRAQAFETLGRRLRINHLIIPQQCKQIVAPVLLDRIVHLEETCHTVGTNDRARFHNEVLEERTGRILQTLRRSQH